MANFIDIKKYNNFFFIGVGGSGMSALAQYLVGIGKQVSGSDRYFSQGKAPVIQQQLQHAGIKCYPQDESGLTPDVEIVVASTAVEETVNEYRKAKTMKIQIIRRAELLKSITNTLKTIAIAGTSGKSTTVAMLFHILQYHRLSPSLITGAGLVDLQKQGKIGNAFVGSGDWLIIEADESDGTLVYYTPEIGVLLNISKDHKEIVELQQIFCTFVSQVKDVVVVNQSDKLAQRFSVNNNNDFGFSPGAGICGKNFVQNFDSLSFSVNNIRFNIPVIGKHNMENALAAIAVAKVIGISTDESALALATYHGIDRRLQFVGAKNGIRVYDDYAHNPHKVAAALKSCQPLGNRVLAWFQPHGFKPTRFLKDEFIREIVNALRSEDVIFISEIFYAGGTADKSISAKALVDGIKSQERNAIFVPNRKQVIDAFTSTAKSGDIILLMGARDPSLHRFAKEVFSFLTGQQ